MPTFCCWCGSKHNADVLDSNRVNTGYTATNLKYLAEMYDRCKRHPGTLVKCNSGGTRNLFSFLGSSKDPNTSRFCFTFVRCSIPLAMIDHMRDHTLSRFRNKLVSSVNSEIEADDDERRPPPSATPFLLRRFLDSTILLAFNMSR